MAVDATHFLTTPSNRNREQGNHNMFPIGQGPVSGTTTATEPFMPMYGFGGMPVKSESGLSYALPLPLVSRKRPREGEDNHQFHHPSYPPPPPADYHPSPPFNFLTQDFQQHQSEIDRLIARHTMKVRFEMEEKRKYYSRRLITAVEDVIVNKFKVKDEEIEKLGKLNWALEEKVKSLCVENHIWRQLAQTNEATANALRTNLEQLLAHVQEEDQNQISPAAESCCGSNVAGDYNHRGAVDSGGRNVNRMCRNCGKEEATVLIMPCRHLCLCYLCGPLLQNCPICNSPKNLMLRLNLLP